MKVVVTGASGHIGGNLVRALLAEGHEVRALYAHDTRPLDGLPLEKQAVDVLDPAGLSAAFAGAEVAFHLAARITVNKDPDGSVWRTNVEGTRHVVEACLAQGVRRLVHFSSIHALQHNPWDRPLDETRPAADDGKGPCLTYDRTKAAGERVVREAVEQRGLDAVIVNPTAVVGPLDYKPSALGEVALLLGRGRLPGLMHAGFDFVDVRDVAAGAVAAAKQGRKGERYLLGGHWHTLIDLADAIAQASGVRRPKLVVPMWLAKVGAPFSMAAARVKGTRPLFTLESMETLATCHHDIRHTKAEQELGYRPRPLAETMADTVAWFRQAGMLPS